MLARGFKPPRSEVRPATLLRPMAALVLAISLIAPPALGAGASVTAATAAQKEEAGKAFQRGTQALSAGKADDAATEFQRSLDVVDSPNARLMLARALVKAGRPAQAYREFERTAVSADKAAQTDKKYASAADAARSEQADVRSQVGLVTVRVSGEADSVSVGGEALERADWGRAFAVAPGKVSVVLKSPNGEAAREVDVAAGGSAEVDIAAPAATAAPVAPAAETEAEASVSTGSSNPRTLAYVAGGVGIAGIVSFAVFGGLNNAKYRELQDGCINSVCRPDLASERDKGKTYQTIANVSLAVGVVGLGTSAVLLLVGGGDSEKKTARARRNGPTARVGVGPGYVDVSGSF